MPIAPWDSSSDGQAAESDDFKDFGKGKTYANTLQKFGPKKANAQRVAVVLSAKRGIKRSRKR